MLKDGKDDQDFLSKCSYLKNQTWEIKGKKRPGALTMPNARKKPPKGYSGSERVDYKGGFQIKHYAAEVIYDVDYWVEKNRDSLKDDQYRAIASSRYLKNDQGNPRSLLTLF